jgi:sortase (surface protein transpeptidase)
MKYKTVYSFQVMQKLTEGKMIYMLDKANVMAYCVNEMQVGWLIEALQSVDADQIGGRYEFWEKEVEENAEL